MRVTSIDDRPDAAWLPDEFCGLEPLGPTRGGRDVANRKPRGIGQSVHSAAVLDPASSHGV